MTQEQTRQLGVEFERRLQEIHPAFLTQAKLDTDTIYSFLSEYQTSYIKSLYIAENQLEHGSRGAIKLNDTIKTLVRHKILKPYNSNADSDINSQLFKIPDDYFLYIRSTSNISKNYKSSSKLSKNVIAANIAIKQDEVPAAINTYYDSKAIMRTPVVVLESNKQDAYIKVIHDVYTVIDSIDLTYLRKPYAFNVLGFDDNNDEDGAVHSYCELPYMCFDELVHGAVDMYIQDYKFKLQSGSNNKQPQRKQRAKEGEE